MDGRHGGRINPTFEGAFRSYGNQGGTNNIMPERGSQRYMEMMKQQMGQDGSMSSERSWPPSSLDFHPRSGRPSAPGPFYPTQRGRVRPPNSGYLDYPSPVGERSSQNNGHHSSRDTPNRMPERGSQRYMEMMKQQMGQDGSMSSERSWPPSSLDFHPRSGRPSAPGPFYPTQRGRVRPPNSGYLDYPSPKGERSSQNNGHHSSRGNPNEMPERGSQRYKDMVKFESGQDDSQRSWPPSSLDFQPRQSSVPRQNYPSPFESMGPTTSGLPRHSTSGGNPSQMPERGSQRYKDMMKVLGQDDSANSQRSRPPSRLDFQPRQSQTPRLNYPTPFDTMRPSAAGRSHHQTSMVNPNEIPERGSRRYLDLIDRGKGLADSQKSRTPSSLDFHPGQHRPSAPGPFYPTQRGRIRPPNSGYLNSSPLGNPNVIPERGTQRYKDFLSHQMSQDILGSSERSWTYTSQGYRHGEARLPPLEPFYPSQKGRVRPSSEGLPHYPTQRGRVRPTSFPSHQYYPTPCGRIRPSSQPISPIPSRGLSTRVQ